MFNDGSVGDLGCYAAQVVITSQEVVVSHGLLLSG
jgi:hypothetical protein